MRPVVGALLVLVLMSASCGSSGGTATQACNIVDLALIESVVGPATSQAFDLGPLSECAWSGERGVLNVRVESVPDPQVFVEHSIEGTDPVRVSRLEGDLEGGVVFASEAVVAPLDDSVIVIDGSVTTDEMIPILLAAKLHLERAA